MKWPFTISLAMLLCPAIAVAANPVVFRIHSKIFANQDQPIAENLALFDSGISYDLPLTPHADQRFVTVFDSASSEVTLLDRATQVQAIISQQELVKFTAEVRARITKPNEQEQLGLLANVQADPLQKRYQMQFGKLDYVVTTQQPKLPQSVVDYGTFVDALARLNTYRRLSHTPPFGRMSLNDALTKDGRLPLEITRTLTTGGQVQVLRKEHDLTESLTPEDRKQIDQIQGMMQLYRQVPLKQFPRPD